MKPAIVFQAIIVYLPAKSYWRLAILIGFLIGQADLRLTGSMKKVCYFATLSAVLLAQVGFVKAPRNCASRSGK